MSFSDIESQITEAVTKISRYTIPESLDNDFKTDLNDVIAGIQRTVELILKTGRSSEMNLEAIVESKINTWKRTKLIQLFYPRYQELMSELGKKSIPKKYFSTYIPGKNATILERFQEIERRGLKVGSKVFCTNREKEEEYYWGVITTISYDCNLTIKTIEGGHVGCTPFLAELID